MWGQLDSVCFCLLVTRVLCDLFDMGSRRALKVAQLNLRVFHPVRVRSTYSSTRSFRAAPFAYIPNKTNLWAIFIIRSGDTTL